MSDERHVKVEHYIRTHEGHQSPSILGRLIHEHLLESCPVCRQAWERLAGDQDALRKLLAEVPPGSREAAADDGVPSRYLSAFGQAARRLEEETRRLRRERRRARRHLRLLLEVAPEDRVERIETARSRYRSRAFAELLIEECRERVRNEPREAENLASLVPTVLHWTPGAAEHEWAQVLRRRAAAHRANALRVAGDLPQADRLFATLRRDLAAAPLTDASALAEMTSLEASLRIDQRRFTEAEELLDRAALLYERGREPKGKAKVLIKQANLLQDQGESGEALLRLQSASHLLDEEDSFLYLCTVTERALCLCNLEKFDEVEALLAENVGLFEESSDPFAGTLFRGLQGRAYLGQKRYDKAEEALSACRDGYLSMERAYDAALASLDLAFVYLAQGRDKELQQLAGELLQIFRSRRVPERVIATLQLFSKAVTREELSRKLLRDIRARLQEFAAGASSKSKS